MEAVAALYSVGLCGFVCARVMPAVLLGYALPFTLTRENDKIARPVVGRPMENAGRKMVKVVKISVFFFTCGGSEDHPWNRKESVVLTRPCEST